MWILGLLVLVSSQSDAFHIINEDKQTLSISLGDIVDKINNQENSLWTAGHNFHPETPLSYFKTIAGGVLPLDESIEEHREILEQINEIKENAIHEESEDDDLETMGCKNAKGLPRNFDARKKWPQCPSIGHIIDQSHCGSCWAVSVASAISDRLCIATNGFFKEQVSSQQVLSCTQNTWGCNGGWPQLAWRLWGHQGVVTGGDYNSKKGCQPYPYPPCEHHTEGPLQNCSALPNYKASSCSKECSNKEYQASFAFDITKGKKARMVSRCNAMRQIYEHGPLVAIYKVYEDFLQYKSGVYQHNVGEVVGLHAVRVIGWGIDNNIPYWLVTNSWNDHWGDHGTFKILRGENEADIEMGFNAGFPEFLQL